ncbi:hypothetical protein [Acinetobacter ursingii]|uniref:hypothetical protein n=1 Tax=Acinetobacter ursingii TaxID=108980 RepID=UPI0012500A1D|nr:hypothetical protein [Acinetobacter ursingii]
MYGLKKRQKDESGLIQGAGTGTSDDVKKNVPAGSYIMPADSTEKIGSKNLKKLGNPQSSVGVNVSDGEYLADPNQLQAIGGFVLDRMKQATHTPVDQPRLGFKPGNTKPQMFFANGTPASGVPDDTFLGISKSAFTALGQPKNQTFVPQQQNAQTQAAAPKKSNANFGLGEFDLGFRMPEMNSKQVNPVNTFSSAFSTNENKSTPAAATSGPDDTFLGISKSAFTGNALGQPKNQTPQSTINTNTTANPKILDTVAQTSNTKPATTTPPPVTNTDVKDITNTNTTPPTTQSVFDQDQPTSNQQTTKPNPFAIQQNGNSFSYADPGAASQARANGLSDGGGFGLKVRPANDPIGVKNMFANTREMGPTDQQIQNAVAQREMNLGMQGFGGIARQPQAPQRTAEQEAERQQIMRELHTPYKGSQNGQLTARQMDNIVRMQTGDDDRAQQRYVTDANNAANIAQTGMREAAQTGRTAMQEQGSNDRFNSNLNLDAQKFNATNDLANRQFGLEQNRYMPEIMKQRAEISALQRYEQAQTPEESQAAKRILDAIRGQQAQKGGLKAVYGGQTLTDQGAIRNPDILVDENTGRQIDYGASQKQQQLQPTPEMIEDLRKNPNLAKDFEDHFGKGSAAKYLKA